MKSKSSIFASGIFARVSIVLGALIALFGMLMTITGITTDALDNNSSYIAVIVFCICICVGGVFLLVNGIRTVNRISRFRRYIALISQMNIQSIQEISRQMSQQPEFTIKDLNNMIRKRYFMNAYIDVAAGKIIILHATASQGNPAAQNAPSQNPAPVQSNAPSQPQAPAAPQPVTVNCSGCGAVNSMIPGQGMSCEYCGSPLK